MVIKQATTSDLDAFYELFTEIMHEGYAGYTPSLINHFLTKDYNKTNFFLWLERFFRNIYIALENEKVIGFIVGDFTYGGVAFISWLGVKEEFRKKGVGLSLFNVYEEFAKSKKAHLIELYTYPKVEPFYLKLGFTRVGVREQGYFGQKNLIMNKKLGEWDESALSS